MDPYVRVRKRELYRNPWLAVETHDILHPTGVPGEHLLIVTPAPCAAVVEDGDDLLFTRQPRFGARSTVVEIVKGGREDGESPQECAARELREELGVEAREWLPLGRLYEIPSIVSDAIELFLARGITPSRADPEAVESIEPVRLPIAQALRAAASGEFEDAITVAALFRYAAARGFIAVANLPDPTDTPARPSPD